MRLVLVVLSSVVAGCVGDEFEDETFIISAAPGQAHLFGGDSPEIEVRAEPRASHAWVERNAVSSFYQNNYAQRPSPAEFRYLQQPPLYQTSSQPFYQTSLQQPFSQTSLQQPFRTSLAQPRQTYSTQPMQKTYSAQPMQQTYSAHSQQTFFPKQMQQTYLPSPRHQMYASRPQEDTRFPRHAYTPYKPTQPSKPMYPQPQAAFGSHSFGAKLELPQGSFGMYGSRPLYPTSSFGSNLPFSSTSSSMSFGGHMPFKGHVPFKGSFMSQSSVHFREAGDDEAEVHDLFERAERN